MRKLALLGLLSAVALLISACGSAKEWTPIPLNPTSTDSSSAAQSEDGMNTPASSPSLDKLQQALTKAPILGEGGSITVEVTYDSSEYFKALAAKEARDYQSYDTEYDLKNNLVFTVAMNTHSVDLSKYKLETITVLRDDKGAEYPAARWIVPEGSASHHTTGTLIVPAAGKDGKLVTESGAKYVELVIKGLSNVPERVFRWELPVRAS